MRSSLTLTSSDAQTARVEPDPLAATMESEHVSVTVSLETERENHCVRVATSGVGGPHFRRRGDAEPRR